MVTFRLPGASTDYLVLGHMTHITIKQNDMDKESSDESVDEILTENNIRCQQIAGSDSGRVSVLEFVKDRNQFERLHLETFGKSGCRYSVYLRVFTVASREIETTGFEPACF